MTRALAAVLLTTLALAPVASADPIAIRHDRDANAIALAGPDVIVMSEAPAGEGGVKVVAVPRAGGQTRTLLRLPDAGWANNELAASAQRVAVITEIDGTKTRATEHRVYSGPPSGPLQLVRQTADPHGDQWEPFRVSVDGDRVLLVEAIPSATSNDDDGDDTPFRAQILDASGWTPIPWVTNRRVPLAIAGSYAAVGATNPSRVELTDLTTGTPLATLTGTPTGEQGWRPDLEPNGRLTLGMASGIEVAGPGEPQHNIPNSGRLTSPVFAGNSIFAFDEVTDQLVDAGTHATLGPKSLVHTDVDGDEGGVAWLFNGCVRYAPLVAPAAPAAKDPCPTTEVGLYTIGPSSKLRNGTVRVPVFCVSSATGRCHGRLIVRMDFGTPVVGRGNFDLPVRDRYFNVTVRFNAATAAMLRRGNGRSALVNAIVRNGTVGTGSGYAGEFSIEVDDRS